MKIINEKNYKEPDKLYNIEKDKAYWPADAEDWLWWSSEADDWAEDYAKAYRVKISPYDFLDLTTEKGASNLKYGDMFFGGALKDLDIAEFNQEKHQPMFLQIAFRDKNNPNLAQVIGHEGRHRMFGLMKAGVKEVDIELRCDVYDTRYNKYKPFKLDYIILKGQFNDRVRVTVRNPIPMSWKNHKEMRPGLKEEKKLSEGVVEEIPLDYYRNTDNFLFDAIIALDGSIFKLHDFKDRNKYESCIYFTDYHPFIAIKNKPSSQQYETLREVIKKHLDFCDYVKIGFNYDDFILFENHKGALEQETGEQASLYPDARLNENGWKADEVLDAIYEYFGDRDKYVFLEKIVKVDGKYQVQSEKGKNLGTYDTEEEARKRLKQIHYFQHLDEEKNINESLLLEKTRNQLIDKSKKSDNYKSKGREKENRWTRRNKSRIANTVRDYNRIDMDAFFKADILDFIIKVRGETNNYEVQITFEEALKEIADQIKKNNNKLEFKCVLRGLISAFNRGNVYVSCSCPDRKYRQSYWSTKGQYNSGMPQPSNGKQIANPNDTKGAGCKHVNLVLANLDWMMKIASVINNYIYWARDNLEMQYASSIFPVIYGMPYDKAIQLTFDMYDETGELKPEYTDDTLKSNIDVINMSNMLGAKRTQYKKKPQQSVNPRYSDIHNKTSNQEQNNNELELEFENEDQELDMNNN